MKDDSVYAYYAQLKTVYHEVNWGTDAASIYIYIYRTYIHLYLKLSLNEWLSFALNNLSNKILVQ